MMNPSRRLAWQRLAALAAAQAAMSPLLGACGGGGGDDAALAPAPSPPAASPPSPPPPPPPNPLPTTPALERLKRALQRAPLTLAARPVEVTQGAANSASSSLGPDARFYPALGAAGRGLAELAEVWGHARERWVVLGGAVIASQAVQPVQRAHLAATLNSVGVCGLHFEFDGPAFEILFAGSDPAITLVVDGEYMAADLIRTALHNGVRGAALSAPNSFVRFDFGSAALRRISVYSWSSQGPCAIAVGAGDRLQAWDRSDEASFAGIADSYGGGRSPRWRGGPYWEAAAQLGVPHLDLDAIGSTGYAANAANGDTRNAGNAFPARLASSVDALPDLFFTAGGINDNNSFAAVPYASAAAARDGFIAAVRGYYAALRDALPDAVLVAMGPWAPQQSMPTHPVAQSKADVVRAALQAVGGLWVFLDNLNGGWLNSAGGRGAAGDPWQTGTGYEGAPHGDGDGNGDVYLSADGVHPNEAGCLYLGTRIATDLRAALLAM